MMDGKQAKIEDNSSFTNNFVLHLQRCNTLVV